MQPLSPLSLSHEPAPNFEALQASGWSINTISGPYCVAFRGRDEVVLQWRDGTWHRVIGRGSADLL
jgi:hypothetical protein